MAACLFLCKKNPPLGLTNLMAEVKLSVIIGGEFSQINAGLPNFLHKRADFTDSLHGWCYCSSITSYRIFALFVGVDCGESEALNWFLLKSAACGDDTSTYFLPNL